MIEMEIYIKHKQVTLVADWQIDYFFTHSIENCLQITLDML